jgi:hypothetical protein
MSTVAEIKEAIAKLSPREYCELLAELRPRLPDDEWDKQMKADAASGKLDFIDRNIENMEDLMELRSAIERNAGKPGVPWEQVKPELGLA